MEQAARDAGTARYRSLLSTAERMAQFGISEHDCACGTSIWSDQFHAILGLKPGESRPSKACFLACVHPLDRERIASALRGVVTGKHAAEQNFRIIRPNGEIRIIHGRAEPTRDDDGRVIRLDAIIQDITERKRLEDELDGLIRELWRSNEELEQFAYVASHDLRQPLRVVGSYVSLLEEELQGQIQGDALEYMAFVRDGVRRMDRLINDLLTYSRVGRTSSDRRVSLDHAMAAALADLQFEIEDSGGRVIQAGPLPEVLGDESEMERLFQNLIGNALKYHRPDTPPEVTVGCREMDGAWIITVADNGIGIPPEHAERVFGIFQRLHARDEYEGTGVGLAIVKKIVERHGGSIRVEPDRPEGAALTVLWPKNTDLPDPIRETV